MPPPAVSVIINNYNYAAFVGTAIESAIAQQGLGVGEVEIIAVDDGSTDDSRRILSQYSDRACVLFKANGGQASAINAGVRASSGKVLCFLDADDWWAPGKIAAILAAFRSDRELSLVYHRLQQVSVDGTPISRPIPRTLCNGDLRPRMLQAGGWWPFPMTSAVAIRRSAWDAAGDIPESFRISADAWIVGVVPFLGGVRAIPDALGCYRLHQNNWYRKTDDAPMLHRRMAHWEATVNATNAFFVRCGDNARLSVRDHFPHAAAAAQLDGVPPMARLKLARLGLTFRGEPNLLRRIRDVGRLVAKLRTKGLNMRAADRTPDQPIGDRP